MLLRIHEWRSDAQRHWSALDQQLESRDDDTQLKAMNPPGLMDCETEKKLACYVACHNPLN